MQSGTCKKRQGGCGEHFSLVFKVLVTCGWSDHEFFEFVLSKNREQPPHTHVLGEEMGNCATVCNAILAIFLPPLGVGLAVGCTSELLLNVLLTLLGWIPGVIHAFYIIGKYSPGRPTPHTPPV